MREPAMLQIGEMTARRILVIAPHPDDESLGCGGLIASLARLGRQFHVVFVTDGGASHAGSKSWPRARLAAQREEEAAAALECLGIGAHPRTFLRLADAGMPPLDSPERRRAVTALRAILQSFEPELALLPWRRDPHRDHRDGWALCHAAFEEAGCAPPTLEYAIWLDELGAPPDRPGEREAKPVALDISNVASIKRRAVEAHVSQTTALIDDDPAAFRLSPATIERLTSPREIYWRPFR